MKKPTHLELTLRETLFLIITILSIVWVCWTRYSFYLGMTSSQHGPLIYLSDRDPLSVKHEYLTMEKDRTVEFHTKLSLDGIVFEKGIGTHANSQITHVLNKGYGTFEAVIGLDDIVGNRSEGSVRFIVKGDDRELYRSVVFKPETPSRYLKLSVDGINLLTLIVEDAGDGNVWDVADWANARLLLR